MKKKDTITFFQIEQRKMLSFFSFYKTSKKKSRENRLAESRKTVSKKVEKKKQPIKQAAVLENSHSNQGQQQKQRLNKT